MELWFSEYHTDDVRFEFRVKQELYHGRSEIQEIAVLDTVEFGRVLVLDDCLMLTEKDEFIYHEMITHPAMAIHPNPKNILIIGAGDGGTLREICRYPGVETIDLVEIDEDVIDVSQRFFPQLRSGFDDPRVTVHINDGLAYVRSFEEEYDIIIVDSTDPFGPGEGLFTREFYGNCYEALREDGLLINQHESPYYRNDAREVQRTHLRTKASFPINELYQVHIPTYPSGHWLFGFISKKYDPVADLDADRWNAYGIKTRYYNTDLHKGAFALPNYVLELLGKGV